MSRMGKRENLPRNHVAIPALVCILLFVSPSIIAQDADSKIAFYSARSGRDDIFVMNPEGSNAQLVTIGESGGKCPDLSPDGTRIVFVTLRDGNSELYLLDLASGCERRLTDLPSVERQPKWSPDGRHIAFQSNRDGNYDIYIMDADGANWQRLTFTDAEELWPNWSPDGSRLAFSSDLDGNWEIYIVNVDGSGLRRLTTSDNNETGASWSPDGYRLAFRSGPPRQFQGDIHIMNADGTNETTLTNFDGVEENPIWSPDGAQIAFQTMKDGNFEIYVMDADGSDLKNLTNHPANDYWPSWVSPLDLSVVGSHTGGKLPASAVELQILYDDVPRGEHMTSGRGFSCLVKVGDTTLLLDAGGDGALLMSNMTACGRDPAEIDIIMISHCNSDHIGGLPTVLRGSGTATRVYLPGGGLPGNLGGRALEIIPAKIDSAKNMVKDVFHVEGPGPICTGVMTTGPLGDEIPEQSLVIQTDAGVVVITGCAHPGVDRIVRSASELTGEPILLAMGGFHLVAESQELIESLAVELDSLVEYVAPCHCSGDLARQCFRRQFGDHCLELGAGSVLRVADFLSNRQD